MVGQLISSAGSIGNSMVGGYFERKRAEEAAQALRSGISNGEGYLEDDYATQQGIYDPYAQVGPQALQDYQNADFQTQVNPFEFGGTVNEYLDPSMDFQREEALKAMQQSASASGGLYSGAAMKELQDRSQDYAMQDYGNAFNRMNTDRGNKYQEYSDNFKMRQQNNATKAAQLQNLIQTGQWGASGQSNASSAYNTGMANLGMQSANINAAQANIPGAFENFATSAMQQIPGVADTAMNQTAQPTTLSSIAPQNQLSIGQQMGGINQGMYNSQMLSNPVVGSTDSFGTSGNLGDVNFGVR